MNFGSFTSEPLHDYVDQVRRSSAVWVFQHIPKTAGTSLVFEISHLLSPYCNIHAPFDDPQADRNQLMVQAIDDFIATHRRRPYRFASGHLNLLHRRRIREALPDTRFFSILRDPVERLISAYRYMSTPRHPPYREHLATYPTIEEFVADRRHANVLTRFLGPTAQANLEKTSRYIAETYCFIGFVEDYDLTFRFLTFLMTGKAITPTARKNETDVSDTNNRPISDLVRTQIIEQNRKDVELYQYIYDIYQGRRADMERMMS